MKTSLLTSACSVPGDALDAAEHHGVPLGLGHEAGEHLVRVLLVVGLVDDGRLVVPHHQRGIVLGQHPHDPVGERAQDPAHVGPCTPAASTRPGRSSCAALLGIARAPPRPTQAPGRPWRRRALGRPRRRGPSRTPGTTRSPPPTATSNGLHPWPHRTSALVVLRPESGARSRPRWSVEPDQHEPDQHEPDQHEPDRHAARRAPCPPAAPSCPSHPSPAVPQSRSAGTRRFVSRRGCGGRRWSRAARSRVAGRGGWPPPVRVGW